MTAAVSVRHATLTLSKREQWYEDIRPSIGGSDFNPLAASGEDFFCTAALLLQYSRGCFLCNVQCVLSVVTFVCVRCSEKVH